MRATRKRVDPRRSVMKAGAPVENPPSATVDRLELIEDDASPIGFMPARPMDERETADFISEASRHPVFRDAPNPEQALASFVALLVRRRLIADVNFVADIDKAARALRGL